MWFYLWKATRALARRTASWPRNSSLGGKYHRNRASLSTSPDCWSASHMHDTCSDENDRLRLVCKKSDTVTEPAGPIPPLPVMPPPPTPTLDEAELSLSASMQLPGDKLTLPPFMSLGDRYEDMTRRICTRIIRGERRRDSDARVYWCVHVFITPPSRALWRSACRYVRNLYACIVHGRFLHSA